VKGNSGQGVGPLTSSSSFNILLASSQHLINGYNCGSPGYLYVYSTTSGWRQLSNTFQAGNKDYFSSVSMSANGKFMIAASVRGQKSWNCGPIYDEGSSIESGLIYGSSNYGLNWKRIGPKISNTWAGGDFISVACNYDCSVIVAAAENDNGRYLMLSTNFGSDWSIDDTTSRSNKIVGTRSTSNIFYTFENNVGYSISVNKSLTFSDQSSDLVVICSNEGGYGCCSLCILTPCTMTFSNDVTFIGITTITFSL
jgi:hypothetical protein